MTMPNSPYGGGPGAGLTIPALLQAHPIGKKPEQLLPKQREAWPRRDAHLIHGQHPFPAAN